MSRFPVLLNQAELAAVLTGLRFLQTTWNDEDPLEPFYNLPPGLDDIVSDGGSLEPLTPDQLDSVCERINGAGAAPVSLPDKLERVRSFLSELLDYEADEFDGPADQDLEVSGADLVDWFTELRNTARELGDVLDAPPLELGPVIPEIPAMARLFCDEGSKAERSPVIVTFKGGLTHPFESWSYGAGFLVGDGPNGSRIVCDVAEIALAHFVDEIPLPMLQGAYGIFPETVEREGIRTLDGD